MTFDEFIATSEEYLTKASSVVVTLAALVDKADSAADMIPAAVLPENLVEARQALDVLRTYLDQASTIVQEMKR